MENIPTPTPAKEPIKDNPGGYKVENVILISSVFSREIAFDHNNFYVTNEINIDSAAHETSEDNKFGVALTLEYKGKQNDVAICTSVITMIGIFEKFGEPVLAEEAFKKINAPAIIYPFIREHLHNICLKAGITNIFLPTVNFKI